MTAFKRIRGFVDRDLGTQTGRPGTFVFLIAALPFFGVPLIGNWWWIPSVLFSGAWLGFAGWRIWWILKTGLIDADRSDWVEPR